MSESTAPAAMPSIEEVAAQFSGKGGTTSDPNLVVEVPETPETPETPEVPEAPETPPPAPKKDPASSRFGALARKEKELRSQMSAFDQKMKDFEAREAAIRERESRFSQVKRPLEALKEMGFTYADVTQDLLGGYKEPEVDPMDEKLNPLKQKWDEFEPSFKAVKDELETLKNQLLMKEQQETYQKTVGEIKDILKDEEKYELTNAMGDEGLNLVQEVILEYWRQNEILLDFSEACDIVEKYYEDDIANRISNTKKYRSRVEAAQPKPAPSKPSVKPASEKSEPQTLTNSLTTGSQAKIDLDSMSHHDAIAYLAKKLQYKE